jgi:hypothetical protein
MITVGEFEYNPERHSIIGPKEYLDEQGEALLKRIIAGEDFIFNFTAHQSPDVVTAVLVRLQTDYAGWKGMRDLLQDLGITEPPRGASEMQCECCDSGTFLLDQDGACARCRHEHTSHFPMENENESA